MHLLRYFLALPASLLLLLVSNASPSQTANDDMSSEQWLYNRPPHIKYFPEDPPHRRRDLEEIQEHVLAGHAPTAVKKMSVDESEKFFPEYWGFQDHGSQHAMYKELSESAAGNTLREEFKEEDAVLLANASAPLSFRPAFAVHKMQETAPNKRDSLAIAALAARNAAAALALLEKRDFQCPGGTSPCSKIAAPNLCCAAGEVCFTIPDNGLGTVGCCPGGASCSGSIACAAGNTPCGSNIGGGCCIPGYICAGIGCIPQPITVVATVTQVISSSSPTTVIITSVVLPVQTSTTTSPTTSSTTNTTATITTTSTTATTTTTSISTPTDTNTALQTTLSCPCGLQACPINLGGGCCPTDRACGYGNLCLSATSGTNSILAGSCSATISAAPSAPFRATSATDTTSTTPVIVDGNCPTGFYACSAYYAGGCCRTGRDCATTNCPSTALTTLVSSGVTIVVPLTGVATTTASASCATGWTSCAASLGGNCCPSGWDCGAQSCTSVGPTSTITEPKEGGLLGAGGLGSRPACLLTVFAFAVVLMVAPW